MMFAKGVIGLFLSCCELLVQIHASQHGGDRECRPADGALVGNTQFLAHRKSTNRRVLIATPLKNAAHALPHFSKAIQSLTYPKAYLSVAFLVSDSVDNTAEVARQLGQGALRDFASVQVFEQDFHYEAPEDRHAYAVQAARRAILAKSRNLLIQKALTDDIFAVLWLDVDITGFPKTLVHDLLGMGRPVVAPHVLIGQLTYDRNSWRENKPEEAFQAAGPEVVFEGYPETTLAGGLRSYMDDLRASALAKGANRNERYAVCIDGVGTAVLFVEARVHREGVVFPEVPYKKRLESEGFGLWAKDRGFQPCGLPFYEVYHFDEWTTTGTRVGTHRKLASFTLNKTGGIDRSKEKKECMPWCRDHESPWATKCDWTSCNGCPLCSKEVGCAARCAQFRNGAKGTEAFLCVGPSENGGSPCYPPSNGKCPGNMPRCETQTSTTPVTTGASDGVCAGPLECKSKDWSTCRQMQTQEGKCTWQTLPSKTANTSSVKAPPGECAGPAECSGKDFGSCQQLQRQEGKCAWKAIKPGEALSGECVGKAECDDKDKSICQQLRREGKCAWVPAPSQRKTPTGDCLGQAECIGKTRRICHRMREQEGKCSWKPAPENEVKVKVTIKNVNFRKLDAESKEELHAALQTTIADKAGVDESAVNVTLTAGSVKVSAVIDLEERIGIMEGESEGQNVDLVLEMESLKDEVQKELETGDVKQELLTVASSVEGIQVAAEGEITITDPETSVTVHATSTETKTTSVDSGTPSELAASTTTPTASSEQRAVSAAVRHNAFAMLLVGSVVAAVLH